MTHDAGYWIDRLALVAHPEGGFYRETYRSTGTVPGGRERDHPAGRSFSTTIYYLLRSGQVSRLHRLRSDEVFHFYCGSALVLHVFGQVGGYATLTVGDDPERGDVLQAAVRAGDWFGATVDADDSFALVGCTVAPGFEFADFELADRARLIELHPRHRGIIERLTDEFPPRT